MSLVCYSLYFTDFVGEAVFGGDPSAAPGSEKRRLYDQGVQFGCWGMYFNGAKSIAINLYFFIHAQIYALLSLLIHLQKKKKKKKNHH